MCYSEIYVDFTVEQVYSVIAGLKNCITVNFMLKELLNMSTVLT